MTLPSVSDTMNPSSPAPAEQGPWLTYNGQPFSPAAAAAKLAELDADKDFVKAALGGDVAKQQERAAYREMARGRQPGALPTMPADAGAVAQQMDEREQQINQARVDTFARRMTMTPERRATMNRGLATKDQIEQAKGLIERAKRDPGFRAKVLSGDMDAGEKWASWHYTVHHCREAPADYDWSKDTVEKFSVAT